MRETEVFRKNRKFIGSLLVGNAGKAYPGQVGFLVVERHEEPCGIEQWLGGTAVDLSPENPTPFVEKIGDLIAEVMEKVGKDGVITVEESKGITFETEYVEGMQFDRGYISPYFVTNAERMETVIDDPYILITDKKISAISDFLPARSQRS